MLCVHEVSKSFGGTKVIDRISFAVGKGEIVGFLGPNGAGKTTTLRILAGFIDADDGTVKLDGHEIDSFHVRRRVGYLPESFPVYGDMRVEEFLEFRAALKGAPRGRVREVLALVGLEKLGRCLLSSLSKGIRQRVGLADALVADPPLLLLDEPTVGLDPGQIRELRSVMLGFAQDRALLISSHLLSEIDAVAKRVIILVQGKVVAEAPPEELRARLATGAVMAVVSSFDMPIAMRALGDSGEVVDASSGRLRIRLPAERAAQVLVANGCALRDLRPEERSLEDVFLAITSQGPS